MQRLHLVIGPGKRCDVVGDVEQSAREIVPRRLVVGKCGRCPLHNRARQQFRIAQCVRDAVSGEWILEVPGVADKRPPGPGAALDKTDLPAEPTYRLHSAGRVEPRVEDCGHFSNEPPVCRDSVTRNLAAKACRRHRHEYTGRAVVGGDGADACTGPESPVIAINR